MGVSRIAPGGFFADADFDFEARAALGTGRQRRRAGAYLVFSAVVPVGILVYMLTFSQTYPERANQSAASAH
jgi:hypothetical protein